MSGVVKSDLHFRIGHVLFIDIVGYSNLLITEQHDHVEQLNRLVRASHCFQTAKATGQLLCLPTGDGMALVFSGTVEAALECALEVAKEKKIRPYRCEWAFTVDRSVSSPTSTTARMSPERESISRNES